MGDKSLDSRINKLEKGVGKFERDVDNRVQIDRKMRTRSAKIRAARRKGGRK